MKGLFYLFLLFANCTMAYAVDIPDDFVPIDNNSMILYSYEFDEPPVFMKTLSDDRILIATKSADELELFIFDNKVNEIFEIGEIELTRIERMYQSYIEDDKLVLILSGVVGFGIFSKGDAYSRKIVYDIKNEKIESNTLLYLFQYSKLDYNEIQDELNLTSINHDLIKIDAEKYFEDSDLALNAFPIAMDMSPNALDFSNPMAVGLSFYPDKLYDNVMLLSGLSNNGVAIKPIKYKKLEEVENLIIQYADYKSESITFLAEWYNPETEKNYMSLNKVTKDGKIAETIKEIPLNADYRFQKFSPIEGKVEGSLELIGYAEKFPNGSNILDYIFEPGKKFDFGDHFDNRAEVSHFAMIKLNLNTLEFDLKIKSIEESTKGKPELKKVELVLNNINKVIEKDNGYLVFAENSYFGSSSETRSVSEERYNNSTGKMETKNSGRTRTITSYESYFRNINLFFLDENMNLQWSTEIEDRDMMRGMSLISFPNMLSSKLEAEQYLQPTITDSDITFIYSTTEPEEEIRKVKISLTDGKILEEHSLFENDGYASFIPGNQINLGKDAYGTILDQDDYYFVKYKLLK